MIAWIDFTSPMLISSAATIWLLIPVCLAVAVVYKTVRTAHLRNIFREVVVLMVYMLVGLVALGAGLWAIQSYWP